MYQKIEENTGMKSLIKIPKKKFVRNGNGKEEGKELLGTVKPESRSTKESKGTPNPDVKSKKGKERKF